MSLDERFLASVQQIKNFTKRCPDADLLQVYGLYKQATEGDNHSENSGDGEAKQKWEAWNALKGMSKDVAKEDYIAKVNSLAPVYT